MNAGIDPTAAHEVEFKLIARSKLVPREIEELTRSLGLQVGPAELVRQTDRYLDTAAYDLLRRGSALRLREGAGAVKMCFKSDATSEGEAVRRLEVEESVTSGSADPVHAWDLPARLLMHVEPVTFTRPLREIARLENQRVRHTLLHGPSGAEAELCIDRVRVLSSQDGVGTSSFSEVEIEAKRGDVQAFAPLTEALAKRFGLELSRPSKLDRALLAAGGAPPRLETRRASLHAAMPFREAAARVFRASFETLRAAEPVARSGHYDEGVHRMRVATRRLRAAFRIFGPAFGERRLASAERLFGKTGRMLGPVRDLDVLLARLPQLSRDLPEPLAVQLEPLLHLLLELRDDRRKRMLAWLSSRPRLHAMERFEAFVAQQEARYGIGAATAPRRRRRGPGDLPTGAMAQDLLHAAARRVFKKGDKIGKHSPPETLHELRIAVKRLRYTSDALEDVAPRDLVLWLKQTAEIQELLGGYNDARTMESQLTGWIETSPVRRLPRKTVLAMGGILGVQERRARESRKAFRRLWREFAREKWRRRLLPEPEEAPLPEA